MYLCFSSEGVGRIFESFMLGAEQFLKPPFYGLDRYLNENNNKQPANNIGDYDGYIKF